MLQYVVNVDLQTANKPVTLHRVWVAVPNSAASYWPKILQYVLLAIPNSAVSYWPKMLLYVLVIYPFRASWHIGPCMY